MTNAEPWTCPACNERVNTPFCGRCGEEPPIARNLTFRGLLEIVVHAVTSIDARAVRTLRSLLGHPGALTSAWVRGIRRPYVAPFQIFLSANVLFFGMQWLTGQVVFSSPLASHLHHQDWSELARSLVGERLALHHVELQDYAPVFDRAVVLHAKSLVVLMTVPFALVLPLVFLRSGRPFMTHVVFSLHLYTFLLLLFCVALGAAKVSAMAGYGGLEVGAVDIALSIVNLAACAVYLYAAIGRVYGASGAARVAQAALLSMAVAAIIVGYRFVIFLITVYAT